MKILIIARCKSGRYAPFITEQVEALQKKGVECEFFPVINNHYLRHLSPLIQVIKQSKPNIIHAHYGLCGVLANLQHIVPVVTTYHGSDINNPKVLPLSKIAIRKSAFNIFVSKKNINLARPKKNYALIPCGINLEDYPVIDKLTARNIMGLDPDRKYVLFSGAFDNKVKNYPLARDAMALVPEAELLELKGFTRSEVATLMQAVDAFLMTSLTEGSPQVIKEALVCGCPIVSVDVGDVKDMILSVEGCFLSDKNKESLKNSIEAALIFGRRTEGKKMISDKELTNEIIVSQLFEIYSKVCRNI